MSGGYIKLHRKICDNPIWQTKPFSQGQAWIDLLLLAEWQDRTVEDAGETIIIPRGSLLTSTRELAERWGWSKDKVSRFLKQLVCDTMCDTKRDTKRATAKTLITLVNYSDYQDGLLDDATQNETQNATQNETLPYRKEEVRRNKRKYKRARARENSFHNFEQRDTDLDAFIIQEQRKGG